MAWPRILVHSVSQFNFQAPYGWAPPSTGAEIPGKMIFRHSFVGFAIKYMAPNLTICPENNS